MKKMNILFEIHLYTVSLSLMPKMKDCFFQGKWCWMFKVKMVIVLLFSANLNGLFCVIKVEKSDSRKND